ncbi:MAG: 6-bladed beta-propeller [Tannerella sp.]|jgi:hypothetical protein|nr:6-bladed beta-propeller [Tannerella sp.]
MKKVILILTILLFVMTESRGQRQASRDDIIPINVTRTYSPQKEVILQDFTDVEYVVLETNDDFVNQGRVMEIGNKYILVTNHINDGDIFIYDRHGKALRKINRKGQGGEEYTSIFNIALDEENDEVFVNDIMIKKF